jgi:hypothetical protein
MSENSSLGAIDNANADEAYERVLPEAMQVGQEAMLVINLDIMSSVFTVMGILEKLPPFLDDLRRLPNFSMTHVEKLKDYVLAMYTAQLRYTFASTPPEQIPALLQEATKWRDILIADAKALVARGHLKAELLKELTGTHGYRNVAVDLSGLSTIFKGGWAQFEGNVGLKKDDLAEADRVALRLAGAVAHRENAPEAVAEATEIRQRIFTLFYTAYDQVRRGMHFLRWDADDVDTIVPSLYAGRPNTNIVRKNAIEANGEEQATETAESAPKPTAATVQAPADASIPIGYPGGEPLEHQSA